MMRRVSIRLRLTLWYSAVLLLGLVLFGGGMWFSLEHRLLANLDERLTARVEGLRTVLVIEGVGSGPMRVQEELNEFAREVPEGSLIQFEGADRKVFLPFAGALSGLRHLKSERPVFRNVAYRGQRLRILTTKLVFGGKVYYVLVGGSLEDISRVMADFRRLLLLMILPTLIVAMCGGYWLSRRALAPVDSITAAAKSITVQNLSRRLEVPRTGDELQRMSEAWNDVLARLEGAIQRIRQFTADASHELRTPLALIRATAELSLRRERTAEQYRDSLRTIQGEAECMTELTEALLMLARSDAGNLPLPLTAVDLNLVVADLVHSVQPIAEAKGIDLSAKIASAPAPVQANEPAIRRLLLVLLDNALKYTGRGGTVAMAVTPAGARFLVSVEDTGVGIPASALPHLFQRFYRIDPAREDRHGAGLGLSIAQTIAQAHGAEISVESTPGAGSRFALALKA